MPDNPVVSTLLASMIGGTISELSGGKFRNGARSAAIVHLFNHHGPGHGDSGHELTEAQLEELSEALRADLVEKMDAEIARLENLEGDALIAEFGGGDVLEAASRRTIALGPLKRKGSFTDLADKAGRFKSIAEEIAQDAATFGLGKLAKPPSLLRKAGETLGLLPSMKDHLRNLYTTSVGCKNLSCQYEVRARGSDRLVLRRDIHTK
jgi:hypothetical protein